MFWQWVRLGRRRLLLLLALLLLLLTATVILVPSDQLLDDVTRTAKLMRMAALRQSMLQDPGSRCNIPHLPVNSSTMMQFVKQVYPLDCSKGGPDWARCQGHECRVKKEVLEELSVVCYYSDILWSSDFGNTVSAAVTVDEDGVYHLRESDFVEVSCDGQRKDNGDKLHWSSYLAGIRDSPEIKSRLSWDKPSGHAMRYSVLMFGFDSLSRNTFIRKLPKSYAVMTTELNAHILEGYNIVGDGTPQALIPILTGSSELELPDTRKRMGSSAHHVDIYPFIWDTYRDNGYVTAFHEDTPSVGIFTYRLKGFSKRPTDHYMRSLLLQTEPKNSRWSPYCVGELPRHKVMLDYTRQFMDAYANQPRFAFGFHGELSHDDYNLIQAADEDFVEWLRGLKSSGILNSTILIIMSDHGHRFASIRNTLQGKQEERLPWFSLVLPPDMGAVRPGALENLRDNAQRLTTPYDVHATLLDVLGLNPSEGYDIKSKFPPRSLSMFGPISANRTCGQADIEPHWCACLSWRSLSPAGEMPQRMASSLVDAINNLVAPFSDRCARLSLDRLEWANMLAATDGLLGFKRTKDKDGFLPDLTAKTSAVTDIYQIKVRLMPGGSLFEASLSHHRDTDSISVKLSDISRINKYGEQARCIYHDQPQLRKYCYCTAD